MSRSKKVRDGRDVFAAAAAALAGSKLGDDEGAVRALVAAGAILGGAIEAGLPAQVESAIAGVNWKDAESLRRAARFVRAGGLAAGECVRGQGRRLGVAGLSDLALVLGALHVLLGSAQRALLRRARELAAPAAASETTHAGVTSAA
jgi:hypothetical protein